MDRPSLLNSLIDEATQDAKSCLICHHFLNDGELLRCDMFTAQRGRPIAKVNANCGIYYRGRARCCRFFGSLL